VPAAVKLQQEYGEDLQVIFVESQGASALEIAQRQLERKWLGNGAIWTSERPFSTGAGGLPNFALLDADGKVVLHGISTTLMKQMEDKISELVATSKDAPESLPKPIDKAFVDLRKGEYAKALAVLDKQIEKPSGGNAEIAEAASKVRAELVQRAQAHLGRLRWMAENGYADNAVEGLKDFVKAAKGVTEIEEALATLTEDLKSDAMKAELAAAKDFEKLTKKMYEDPKGKHKRALEKFIEKHGATSVSKRAEFWLDKVWE
jgi:hypothetical protein